MPRAGPDLGNVPPAGKAPQALHSGLRGGGDPLAFFIQPSRLLDSRDRPDRVTAAWVLKGEQELAGRNGSLGCRELPAACIPGPCVPRGCVSWRQGSGLWRSEAAKACSCNGGQLKGQQIMVGHARWASLSCAVQGMEAERSSPSAGTAREPGRGSGAVDPESVLETV